MIDPKILKELEKLIDYSWQTEERHWEESDKPRDHIFVAIRRLRWWLDARKPNAS